MIRSLLSKIYHHSFARFLFVGGVGFLSNMAMLYLLKAEMNLIIANIFSYFTAVTVTWALNRILTFHSYDPSRTQEWLRYAMIYIITGGLQALIFAFLTEEFHLFYLHPMFALAITALVIAFVNYVSSKRFAFIRATSQ